MLLLSLLLLLPACSSISVKFVDEGGDHVRLYESAEIIGTREIEDVVVIDTTSRKVGVYSHGVPIDFECSKEAVETIMNKHEDSREFDQRVRDLLLPFVEEEVFEKCDGIGRKPFYSGRDEGELSYSIFWFAIVMILIIFGLCYLTCSDDASDREVRRSDREKSDSDDESDSDDDSDSD